MICGHISVFGFVG